MYLSSLLFCMWYFLVVFFFVLFFSFPYGALGLIVFIPVLCLHSYFIVHRIASK